MVENTFILHLWSPFRKQTYPVFFEHTSLGWVVDYFGNKRNFPPNCSKLDVFLGSDGTNFPEGSERDFQKAWSAINEGFNIKLVKTMLEGKIYAST